VYVALLVAAFARLLGGEALRTPARAFVAAAFAGLVVHTLLYAAFLEDPLTWTLLAVGAALAAPARTRAPLPEFSVADGPAVAAAAFTGSSFALLLYAVRAYVDVPFLALVLWAGALEAARPRRGPLVMGLLALAGLLRPEAWVLAGLYWLWCRGWRSVAL